MKEVVSLFKNELINAYTYGSKVYGTKSGRSDKDYIVIATKSAPGSVLLPDTDIQVHSQEGFTKALFSHEIWALECLFLPEDLKIENIKFSFDLDLAKLRTEISSKSSNSWVKAKKKIEKEKDQYIGEKSLWHSLRIIDFGIQIATTGRIYNYQSMNEFYPLIVNTNKTWNELSTEFKPLYNLKHSQFKKLCPKG